MGIRLHIALALALGLPIPGVILQLDSANHLAVRAPQETDARDGEAAMPGAITDAARERIEERCLEYLWGLYEAKRFPGCSAALVLPDGSSLTFPVGLADVEAERDMTSQDRMLSGSIGKTYVTAAAHKLMLAGKLSWDQRAVEFFAGEDWFLRVPNAETMTLKQLLRHQSGIARHVFKPEFLPDCYADPDRTWKPEELLAYVFDEEPLFEAGTNWAYADTNYIVIGMIIERVAKKPFYEYVRDEFLTPLKLADTVPSDSRRIPGLTQGYIAAFQGTGVPERVLEDGVFFCNPQFEWCGGGYASTSLDLARWAHVLYGGEAMEGDYLTSMLETVPARLGPNKEYGLGVMVASTDLGPAIGHDGIMTGFGATVSHFPEQGISAALMLNTDDSRILGMPLDRVSQQLTRFAAEELSK
ncbi:MAG: D-alanyl-D-alanine carboxypeptidase [Planctomycetota bacterium]|jgi:D-alanyl-D-alanine carboxypeptidase